MPDSNKFLSKLRRRWKRWSGMSMDSDSTPQPLSISAPHRDAVPPRFQELEPRLLLTGTITGNIFEDLNSNGIFDAGELGIADVTVRLDLDGNGSFIDAGDLSAITDANGVYSLNNVPAGSYMLAQDLPNGMTQTLPLISSGDGDGSMTVVDFLQNNGNDHFGNPITDMEQPNRTILSPDGRHLIVWTSVSDSMLVYRREAATGELELLESLTGADGSGNPFITTTLPKAYTYSPDSRFLYSTPSSNILIFKHDDATGLVTLVDTISNNGTDSAGNPVTGMTFPGDIEISPDGLFAYVPSSNEGSILVFSRDNTTGELVFLERYDDGGLDAAGNTINAIANTRYVSLSPDGRHFYATSQTDRSIVIFERNENTGALTLVDELLEGGTDSFGSPMLGTYNKPEFVTLSNDGTSFYFYDDNIKGNHIFQREIATGKLAYVETFDDSRINGNQMDLVFNADDTIGYFVMSFSNQMLSVTRNPTTGGLTLRQTLTLSSSSDPHSNISLSPDGRFLYTEGGLLDSIWRVAVDVGTRQPTNHDVVVGDGQTLSNVNFGNLTQPFTVFQPFPQNGAIFSQSIPETITIHFNRDVDASSVQASDLQVDGVPALSVTVLDADTAAFDLDYTGVGMIDFTIAAGSILDTTGQGIEAFSGHYNVNIAPLTVTNSNPANGATLSEPGPTTIFVQFSHFINPFSVQASDLLIDGVPATNLASVGQSDARFFAPNLSLGQHTIELAAGSVIADTGVHIEPFSATFTITPVPFNVTTTTPSDGTTFEHTGPTQITVNFDDDIDIDSLAKEDLTLNGQAATRVNVINSRSVVFGLPATGEGTHNFAIAQGAIDDIEGTGIEAFSGQFTETIPPFQVTSSTPSNGASFDNAGPSQITINFNDDIDIDSLVKEDLTLNGVPALAVNVINGTTAVFDLPATGAGVYDFAIAQGAISDLDGTPLDAFGGQFTVSVPPFVVLSTNPASGSDFAGSGPSQISVVFNADIDPNSLSASDLTFDGNPATGVNVTGDTVTFDIPVTGAGVHTFEIATNDILNQSGTGNQSFSGSFTVDPTPRVIASSILNGQVFSNSFFTYSATFDMNLVGVTAADMTVIGATSGSQALSSFSYNASTKTLSTNLQNLPDDIYTLTLLSDGLLNTDGVALDGEVNPSGTVPSGNGLAGGDFVIQFQVDTRDLIAVDLQPVAPLGGLIYTASLLGFLNDGDVDQIAINLNAGHELSFGFNPAGNTAARIELLDPANNVLATRTTGAGNAGFAQLVSLPLSGTYTVRITQLAGGIDSYNLELRLNAQIEEENLVGDPNGTNSPVPIDGSFRALPGGGSISGYAGIADTVDYVQSQTFSGNVFSPNVFEVDFLNAIIPIADAVLTITAKGDFSSSIESLLIDMEGIVSQSVFTVGGLDNVDVTTTITINAEDIAAMAADGVVEITATPSSSVNNLGSSSLTLTLTYPSLVEDDSIAINLTQGEVISFVAAADRQGLMIELLSPTGEVIAMDKQAFTFEPAGIHGFVVRETGTHKLRIVGGGQYHIVTTRGAEFDGDFNAGLSQAQALEHTGTVAGYLGDDITAGRLFLITTSGNLIEEITPLTGETINSFTAPIIPGSSSAFGMATTPNTLLVAGDNTSPIVELDPNTGHTIRIINNPGFDFEAMAFQDNEIILVNEFNDLVVLDYKTGKVLREMEFVGSVPVDAMGAAFGKVYGLNNSTLLEFDPVTGVTTAVGNVPSSASGSDGIGVVGNELFLADFAVITVIDLNSLALIRNMQRQTSTRAIAGDPPLMRSDDYSFHAQQGELITIETFTPNDGNFPFNTHLDPILDLFDPTGQPMGGNDNGQPDGRNAKLVFNATQTGEFVVRVRAADDLPGEYILTINGNTMAPPTFAVVATDPTDGTYVKSLPSEITVEFSRDIFMPSLDASDLIVDGSEVATSVTLIDSHTVVFTVPTLAEGAHSISIAGGALESLGGAAIDAFSAQFDVDITPPHIVAVNILEGESLPSGTPLIIAVQFNEALDESSINSVATNFTDLTRGIGIGENVVYDAETFTLTSDFHVREAGDYLYQLISSAISISDLAGFQLDGEAHPDDTVPTGDGVEGGDFFLRFSVDQLEPIAITTLRTRGAAGVSAYIGEATAMIRGTNDVDSFTLDLEAGQLLSLTASAAGASPQVELLDPNGQSLGLDNGIDIAALPAINITVSGVYTINVSAGEPSDVKLTALLNATLETESVEGSTNNAIATAQSLNSAMVTLGGITRATVQGTRDDASDALQGGESLGDLYVVDVLAGQSITFVVAGDNTNFGFDLLDVNGNVLATTQPDDQGFARFNNYVPTANEQIFARITGDVSYFMSAILGAGQESDSTVPLSAIVLGRGGGLINDPVVTNNIFTFLIDDGEGNPWRIAPNLDTEVSFFLDDNRDNFTQSSGLTSEAGGREFATQSRFIASGVTQVRKVYVSPDRAAVRYLDFFENSDSFSRSVSFNVESTLVGSTISSTSSGDTNLSTLDNWAILESPDPSLPRVGVIFDGLNGNSPLTSLIAIGNGARPTYTIIIPANSTVAIMRFTFLHDDEATDPALMAEELLTLPAEMLEGLTRTEIGQIINFDNLPTTQDRFTIEVNAGDELLIETRTPGQAQGQFNNTLDPIVTLFDPTGIGVASDNNSAADGNNVLLSHTALQSGTYTIELDSIAGEGDYVLTVTGDTGTSNAFEVAAMLPGIDSRIGTPVSTIDLVFNDTLLLTSVDSFDFNFNGTSPTGVEVIDGQTLRFTLSAPSPEGVNDVLILGGSILDVQGTPIETFMEQFTVDLTPPRIIGSSLLIDDTVMPGTLMVNLVIDEQLDPTSINRGNVTLTGDANRSADLVTLSESGDRITAIFTNVVEGDYNFRLLPSSSSFKDLVGLQLDGEIDPGQTVSTGNGVAGGAFLVPFHVEFNGLNPLTMEALRPLGNTASRGHVVGSLDDTDLDRFSLKLEAGQNLSVLMRNEDGLQGSFRVIGPAGEVAVESAAAVDDDVFTQALPITQSGTYEIELSGVSGSGTYELEVLVNAVFELESLDGTANNGVGAAIDLNALATALPGSAGHVTNIVGEKEISEVLASQTQSDTLFQPNVLTFDFDGLPLPLGDGTITISVRGDVDGSSNENIALDIEGLISQTLFAPSGSLNRTELIPVTQAQINTLLADGTLTVTLTPGIAVDDFGNSFATVTVDFPAPGHEGGDFYSLALVAGESASVVVRATGNAVDSMLNVQLRDTDGTTVLARGDADLRFLDGGVIDFIAPTTGVYIIHVSGNVDYTLTSTHGVIFDAEPVTNEPNIDLTNSQVLGHVNTHGTGRMFVAEAIQDRIFEIDPLTGAVLNAFDAPVSQITSSTGLAVTPTSILFGSAAGNIFELDADTGATLREIANPGIDIRGLAYQDGKIFARQLSGTVDIAVIDYATGDLIKFMKIGPSSSTSDRLLAASVDDLFVGAGSTLRVVDPATGVSISPGVSAGGVGLGANGFELYATSSSLLSVLDTEHFKVLRQLSFPSFSVQSLGADGSFDDDLFELNVNAGDVLTLTTTTPFDGVSGITPLDPIITLIDPDGNVIDTVDNTNADSRNATLTHNALQSGVYHVRITAADGSEGAYVLSASGSTATDPFAVQSTNPTDGQSLTDINEITVVFDQAFNFETVDLTDLTINGGFADNLTVLNDRTLVFGFDTALVDGDYNLAMSAGALIDLQGRSVDAFTSTFEVDISGPRVVDISIQQNDKIAPGDLTVTVVFDEALAAFDTNDVSLVGNVFGTRSKNSFIFDEQTFTLTVGFLSLPEDHYTFRVISGNGRAEDLLGNDLDGEAIMFPIEPNVSGDGVPGGDFLVEFDVDIPDSVSLAFAPIEPLGSFVYAASGQGRLTSGDTDRFEVDFVAGQTASLRVEPGAPAGTQLRVFDSLNALLLDVPLSDAGSQLLSISVTGTHSIELSSDVGVQSAFEFDVLINAAIEDENVDNNTAPNAQDINASAIQLGNGVTRYAVSGAVTTNDIDFFSFTAQAGQRLSFGAASNVSSGPKGVTLIDPTGTVLAETVNTSSLHNILAPTTGTYLLSLDFGFNSDYVLTAVTDGVLETHPNDFGVPIADITTSATAIGYLEGVNRHTYTFDVTAGDQLVITTATPNAGPAQLTNSFNPRIELFDANGDFVTDDDNELPDGINSQIAHTALMDGVYTVLVDVADSDGEYTVNVAGHSGLPFGVGTSTINDGDVIADETASIQVTFTRDIDLTTLQATDLLVDGIAATGVNPIDLRTAEFTFDSLPEGTHTIELLAGSVTDLNGNGIALFSSAFDIHLTGPRVVAVSIPPNHLFETSDFSIDITFDKAINFDQLGKEDVQLTNLVANGNFSRSVSLAYDEVTFTLTASFANVPQSEYFLTLFSGTGGFEDLQGADLDGEFNGEAPPSSSGDGQQGGNFNLPLRVLFGTFNAVSNFPLRTSSPSGSISINFNRPIDTATVNVDDLIIPGINVGSISRSGYQARYTVLGSSNPEPQIFNFTLPAGAVLDYLGNPNEEYSGTFIIDSSAPRVIDSNVQQGSLLTGPDHDFVITFSEPIYTSQIKPDTIRLIDILRDKRVDLDFSIDESKSIFTLGATNLEDGRYQLILDGTDSNIFLVDSLGSALDGEYNGPLPINRSGDGVPGGDFVIEFDVDRHLQPIALLDPLRADSSLGHQFIQNGQLNGLDVDTYSINLEGGQMLAVGLIPHLSQSPLLEVRDPNNTLLVSSQSTMAGERMFLNGIAVTDPGVYTISVSGSELGEYELQGLLNAAIEEETFNGVTNDVLASAQLLNTHAIPLPGGGSRFTVVGSGDGLLFEQTQAFATDYDPRSPLPFNFNLGNATPFGAGELRIQATGDYDFDNEFINVDIEGMSFVIFDSFLLVPFLGTIMIPDEHFMAAASDGSIDIVVTTPSTVANTSLDTIQLDLSFGTLPDTADHYRVSLNAGDRLDTRALADKHAISMEVLDATGTILLAGVAQADEREQHAFDFVAPTTGDYIIRIVSATGDYTLEATLNATIHANEAARQLINTHVAVGGLNGVLAEQDDFTISVTAGDALVLETQTPGDMPGLFSNTMDPRLTLFDPFGVVVADDFDGAADGRNARIEHTAATDGVYTVRVGFDLEDGTPGLRADYYQFNGQLQQVPSFEGLTPVLSRIDPEINFNPTNFEFADTSLNDLFAVRWTGFIQIDTPGIVEFSLFSDDGSLLYIDDELIIDNDGLHPPLTKTGSVFLNSGAHRIRVEMFENLGGAAAVLFYTPVGGESQVVPVDKLFHLGSSTSVIPEPYVLLVDGNTGPTPPFNISEINLPLNGRVNQNIDSVTVDFAGVVSQPSLDASDFAIDGMAANSFDVIDGNTVRFNFATPFTEGVHQLSMASGAITSTVGTPIDAFATEVTVDTVAPRITDVSIDAGQTVPSGQVVIDIAFDESINTQFIDASDFTLVHPLNGSKTPTFEWNVDNTAVTLTYDNLLDNDYTLILRPGDSGFRDVAGNHLDGEAPGTPLPPAMTGDGVAGGNYLLTFTTDTTTLALTSFVPSDLRAGLMHISLIEPFVGEGDVDTFTLDLEAGQTLTLSTSHLDTTVQVDILGPDDTVLATGSGHRVQLPIVPVTVAGEYKIVYTGLTGSGFVDTQIQLNGALRQVADTPPTGSFKNTHSGAPQNIDDAFISVGTGLRAALGSNRISEDDFYSFNMNAGEVVTIVGTGPNAFRLQDATGTSVALSELIVGTLSEIRHFVAPYTGTYVVGAMNTGNAEKSFNAVVITRDLSFPYDISPDTMDQALEIIPAFDMMGFLSSDDSDFFKLDIRGGETLTLQTQTPGDAPGLFNNDLDVLIELLDADGNVITSNDNRAADDRNALLVHDITFTGPYFIRVTAADQSRGHYLLGAGLSDVTSPTALAEVVNEGDDQRSRVIQVDVQFSEDISDGLDVGDLILTNLTSGQTIDVADLSLSWDTTTNTATWTFPNLTGNSLANGNYVATLDSSQIADANGNPFMGNDGSTGDHVMEFFSYFGDGDGDRDVDNFDLFKFRNSLFTNADDPKYLWWFDFDADGDIDNADLFRFRVNLFTRLDEPSEPAPLMASQSFSMAALMWFANDDDADVNNPLATQYAWLEAGESDDYQFVFPT